jgi:serine/threonine protein phosphatase PrpC
MGIKEILQKLNIKAEEHEIVDFMKHSEVYIGEFLKERWDMFKQEQLFAMQLKGKQIQIPNGKKDKEYSAKFTINDIALPDIESFKLENLPKGISYSAEEGIISGVPEIAGDHKIILTCVSRKGHKAQKEILFIVIPDPKDLWKDIKTPSDIEYYKPDSDSDYKLVEIEISDTAARKNMAAASQRGRSHANEGRPRDDDFSLYFDEKTEWYIMTVADGAGSAKFSRRGSQIACNTAVKVCREQLAEIGGSLEDQIKLYWNEKQAERKYAYEYLHKVVGKAAYEAHKKIREEAAAKQRNFKEYATTLLLCICKKFEFGWFIGAFWVGDGGIGIYRNKPQELKILGEPDGGEFAGQTRFLTMPEIFNDRVRTRFEIVEDFTALILMTDGVSDPKFETDAMLNRIEKWNDLWNDLNGNNEDNAKVDFTDYNYHVAEELLQWLNFWSKGNHDDRTIAILY